MNMMESVPFTLQGLRGTLRLDVDMRRHTSWRAGGLAQRMYQPADLADLAAFLRQLPVDEPLLAVGLGSNLLVRDGGLKGTVLLMHAALNELRIEAGGAVYAQAGIAGAKLARFAALNNLGGAEFFVGIPGTVGGMLAMNAGCYGSQTWEKVERVQVISRRGEIMTRTAEEYTIGYRHVALHRPQEEWFAGAWFRFPDGDGEAARAAIRELLSRRINSQPLNLPNAGSVFRNPPGDYAARLIESCGLKGRQVGGARVSEKHANFIVNTGDATAADIEHLIDEVRSVVEQKTGVLLYPEVKIVGEAL
jgi:UDP-N-acetylenolpyruvoylglucosamine reductase